MPIKFRCHHCRQFLGISRAMAEKVVDCPQCGRSIRVPDLNGNVAPLPQPKLDLADSSLADALDRLASIGEVPGLVLADSDNPSMGHVSEETLEPVALAAPPPQAVPLEEPGGPVAVEPPQPVVPKQISAPPPSVPYEPAGNPLEGFVQPPSQPAKPESRTTLLLIVAVVGLSGALIGILAGRFLFPPTAAAPIAGGESTESDGAAKKGVDAGPPASVAGTVKYRTENGDKPDRGARVLALPDERAGTVKVAVLGLRPGDPEEDLKVARAALNALGGDVALVDEEGNYTLQLPKPGTYQLVVLSHYQPRSDDDTLPASIQELLGNFLDRPAQLIGEGRVEYARVRWQGEGSETVSWSHTFRAADS